jgi:hypothetical protein
MNDTAAFRRLFVGGLILAMACVALLTAWSLWRRASLEAKVAPAPTITAQTATTPTTPSQVGWELKTLKRSIKKTETGFLITISGTYKCGAQDCNIVFGIGSNPDAGSPVGKPLEADQSQGTFLFRETVSGPAPIHYYVDMVQSQTGKRMALTSGLLEPDSEEP